MAEFLCVELPLWLFPKARFSALLYTAGIPLALAFQKTKQNKREANDKVLHQESGQASTEGTRILYIASQENAFPSGAMKLHQKYAMRWLGLTMQCSCKLI